MQGCRSFIASAVQFRMVAALPLRPIRNRAKSFSGKSTFCSRGLLRRPRFVRQNSQRHRQIGRSYS